MCSKSADEIRKTRRNWNTGATAGSEDMPGKSLFSRSATIGSWNFRSLLSMEFWHTYLTAWPEKSGKGYAVQDQVAKPHWNWPSKKSPTGWRKSISHGCRSGTRPAVLQYYSQGDQWTRRNSRGNQRQKSIRIKGRGQRRGNREREIPCWSKGKRWQ